MMFALKIIVITSALLNVGFSATQCHTDEVVEFNCQEPTCSSIVDGGSSIARLRTDTKQQVTIIGYNKDNLLIKKNKGGFSIVGRNSLHIKNFASTKDFWNYKVNIHKKTYEVCDSTNQSNEINHSDSIIAQTNTNIDNIVSKTNDAVDTSRVNNDDSIKSQKNEQDNENNYKETHYDKNDDLDEGIDETVKIENEDESNLDNSFNENLATMNSNAENVVNESFSTNSDQSKSSDAIDSDKSDLNENTNQNDTPKPISPQQLENDSSSDCTLDSCVSDTSTLQKESKENYFIEELNDHTKTTQQLPIVKEMDNTKKESVNNMPQNSNTVHLQDKDNTISVQDINVTKEFNMESSHLQKSDNLQINQQLPSLNNVNSLIKESINNIMPQNSEVVVNLQVTNNVTEGSNTENFHQQQSDNLQFTQQLSNIENVQNDDDAKEDRSHQQQNEDIPPTPNLLKSEDISVPEETVNSAVLVNDTVVDIKDNHESAEEFNETILHKNTNDIPIQGTSDIVNQQGEKNDMPSLKEEKSETMNESDTDNVLPSHTSIINDIKKQPLISDNINESEGYLPTSQNISHNNLSNVESTTLMSNNGSVGDNITHSDLLQKATENVSSTDYPTVSGEVETTEILNKESINQCTSEDECSNPLDSTPKYGYENIEHQFKPENKILPYENVHKNLESNNNEKSKEFEPKSLVSSFGHPDACSGVSCLKLKRSIDKSVRSTQPVPKQVDQVLTSDSKNTNIEEENKNIINEVTDQSDVELNFLDHFHNWISSPTLNSLDFLWYIFGIDSTENSVVNMDQSVENQDTLKHIKHKDHSELYFIVAAVITLLFSLVYYKFQKGAYENHLLTLLAAKDQNLLIVEKELSILKDQSSGNTRTTSERNSEIETLSDHLTKSETSERNSEIETLNEHLNIPEDIISSQAIRIEKLEQEVEELTESGMEMHTLLNSALESNAKSSEKFNILKVKLVDSENLVAALTQKNFDKTRELEKKNDIIKTLQSSVDELTYKSNSLVEDNAKISLQLEQVLTKNTLKESRLQSEINNLQFELDKQTNALLTAENEVTLSKDALQEVLSQKFNPTESKKFLSSVKLSAELKSTKQMSDGYKHKLDESSKLNQQYLDRIDDFKNNIVNLENNISKLEQEKQESVNKLNILTKFFKEQEKEYLKQINEKALLCDNKEGESSDLIDRIKSLNQEIANYKSEIQSLKKEITDQEDSFKIQISAADKKASDNWILFRQTERKFKELELETAQLRNKMTMGDKKLENGAKSIDSSKDFEDELLDIPLPTVSPDFTLLSLLDFEPPPPILTHQRLPPLGALGQAPSPPVPLSRRHDRSLSPGSPPPPQRSSVFRPLPQRYNYMNRQNSLGHSVESLDK